MQRHVDHVRVQHLRQGEVARHRRSQRGAARAQIRLKFVAPLAHRLAQPHVTGHALPGQALVGQPAVEYLDRRDARDRPRPLAPALDVRRAHRRLHDRRGNHGVRERARVDGAGVEGLKLSLDRSAEYPEPGQAEPWQAPLTATRGGVEDDAVAFRLAALGCLILAVPCIHGEIVRAEVDEDVAAY
jgi:hypothetical protein